MSEIAGLLCEYARFVRQPWDHTLAGPQKVWFAIYDPPHERRLRFHLSEFEVATKEAGHGWRLCDLTGAFANWMGQHEYRDAYFAYPDDLDLALPDFVEHLAGEVSAVLKSADDDTVVALPGVASLFGLTRVSGLVERVAPAVRGRLLVFFPGQYEGSNYRLLDARDGWNYLAVPITAKCEG